MEPTLQTRTSLACRSLVRNTETAAVLRILDIERAADRLWLIDIDRDTWPVPYKATEFFEDFERVNPRYIIEFDDPHLNRVAPSNARPASNAVHELRWQAIMPLLAPGTAERLYYKADRKKLLDARADDFGCCHQHLVDLLKLWWKRGMRYPALAPDYDRCGRSGIPRNLSNTPGSKKFGRPRIYGVDGGPGINSHETVKKHLRIAADYWLSPRKPSLQEAIDYIIGLFYSNPVVENGELISVSVPEGLIPTVRQLQYFIHQNYGTSSRIARRAGQHRFDLEHRAITGLGDQGAVGPGDRFQIDATVADAYLVSILDRRRIVGRPVIYFVIDTWSRLIVGIYVGFEGPSWIGAMMALTNMVTPKVEFCRQFGVSIAPEDWPAHHAPKVILGDRGELLSVPLGQNIIRDLGIDIENASSGRADMKELVERRFGVVPSKFKQFVPGYVRPDFGERGAEDYRLKAKLTLNEFTEMVIHAVLEHNFTPIDGKDAPAQMTTDGLVASPLDLWNWGIANRSGLLRKLTVDAVALAVMPRAKHVSQLRAFASKTNSIRALQLYAKNGLLKRASESG